MCGSCDTRCPLKSGKKIQPQLRQCPTECAEKQPACRCKPGYYRFNNLCLLEADCPGKLSHVPTPLRRLTLTHFPDACPKNEKNTSCAYATSCQATCSKPQGGNMTEATGFNICSWQVCDVSSCVCNDGFIRDDKTLQCIPIDDCPTTSVNGAKKRTSYQLN